MKTKLQKWGNSNGVRIPISIVNEMGIKENDDLDIKMEDNKIILSALNHKSIYERIEGYEGNYICEEYQKYDVKGNEIW